MSSRLLTLMRKRGGVPTNAIKDRAGNPVLDRNGDYILARI